MGGEYYEREVYSVQNTVTTPPPNENESKPQASQPKPSGQSFSVQASKALNQNSLHKSNDPKRFAEENRKLVCKHQNPIVFALDVSGSMGDWPKVIYDKLPMFYGQIMMQGYLKDPSVSFCAIDDTLDRAPLQVTDFGQGVQIDQLISKVYLECGGSGTESQHEAYELSAFFYLQQCELENVELPYFFITGDEHFYQRINRKVVEKIMGNVPYEPKEDVSFFSKVKNFFGGSAHDKENFSSLEIFKQLKKKFNVFHLHKPYYSQIQKGELNDWKEALGEEWILELQTPKAVIDVILGVIALTSGSRTIDEYIKDMEARGQSTERIAEVKHSLRHLSPKFLKEKVIRFQKPINEEKITETSKETNIEEEKKEEI